MIRRAVTLLMVVTAVPAIAQQTPTGSAPKKPALDPNERICEEIYVGTRVNTKRFCATRAEWQAKRQQDRDEVDQIQRPKQCSVMTKHC